MTPQPTKPSVIAIIPLPQDTVEALSQQYDLSYQPECAGAPCIDGDRAAHTVAVVTNGSTGCSATLIGQLPALKIIGSFGAGYENIDLAAAQARSVQVSHAPGANAATVADHAIGFALALARGYCGLTAAVKAGQWKQSRGERSTLNGATVGIIGMGRVGQLIARRAAAFDAKIAYFDLAPKAGIDGEFFSDLGALAQASDFLIAACPGGPSTHHIVDGRVLERLGQAGYLVNVSRGTVVVTSDLIRALREGVIAGAGLDVLEEEPNLPQELLALHNVLLTPHVAGRSPASFIAQRESLLESLQQALCGSICSLSVPQLRGARQAATSA
jgi:lactate dehydrogenase-like 2-hydroxyacid dehydrogenase